MELKTYLQIISRRKWIVIFTVTATMVGYIIIQPFIQPSYEAETTLRVIPYSTGDPPYTQLVYANRIMNTYIEIATSGPFLDALNQELEFVGDSPIEISADIVPDTELISIKVISSDPILARDAANTLAAMVISENPIRDLNISIVDPAVTPEPDSFLQSIMTFVLVLVVGLIAGIGLAFLIENLDPRLHSSEEITNITGLKILGHIPFDKQKQNNQYLVSEFPYNEAFRRLRVNLLKITEGNEIKTLMLTSSQPQEGKTTLSANLAISLYETGRRILLIDGDFHQPALHEIFEISNEFGLSNVLQGSMPSSDAIQKSDFDGLDILSSGPNYSYTTELLEPSRISPLFDELMKEYDLILVNAPPYLGIADAVQLSPSMDGIILVAMRGMVRADALQATCLELTNNEANLLGVIINNDNSLIPGEYYKYYKKKPPPPKRKESKDGGEALTTAAPSLAMGANTPQKASTGLVVAAHREYDAEETKESQIPAINKEITREINKGTLPAKILILDGNSPYTNDRSVFLANELISTGYEINLITPHKKLLSKEIGDSNSKVYGYISPKADKFFTNLILTPLITSFVLLWVWLRQNFDVLYIINPPDSLALVGLIPKLVGKTIFMDIRDPLPELYATQSSKTKGFTYWVTSWIEKKSTRFVNHVTMPNDTILQKVSDRDGISSEHIASIPQIPDIDKIKPVDPDLNLRSRAETILAYLYDGRNDAEIEHLINVLNYLKNSYGYADWFCLIIGINDEDTQLSMQVEEMEIDDHIWFAGTQPVSKWAMLLSSADICVYTSPRDPLSEIKIGRAIYNYMAVGKPIVAYDLPAVRDFVGEAGSYAMPDNQVDLADHILRLVNDPGLREEMGQIGLNRFKEQSKNFAQAQLFLSSTSDQDKEYWRLNIVNSD